MQHTKDVLQYGDEFCTTQMHIMHYCTSRWRIQNNLRVKMQSFYFSRVHLTSSIMDSLWKQCIGIISVSYMIHLTIHMRIHQVRLWKQCVSIGIISVSHMIHLTLHMRIHHGNADRLTWWWPQLPAWLNCKVCECDAVHWVEYSGEEQWCA